MDCQQNSSFRSEVQRLLSFQNWPIPHIVAPEMLARAGFYFLQEADKTECAFCKGVIVSWEAGDNPDEEHRRHFPYCPFVQGVIQPRIELTDEVGGTNQVTNANYDSINQRELGVNVHSSPYDSNYVTLDSRLSTFVGWPEDLVQTPDMLANAGFCYGGSADAVQCFSCGGGLGSWNPEDDPWVEHAKCFPRCNYLLHVKGHNFVRQCALGINISNNVQTMKGNENLTAGNASLHSKIRTENNSNNTTEHQQISDGENSLASVVGNTASNEPNASNNQANIGLEPRPNYEANGSSEKSILCKICLEKEVGVVLLPCGHLLVCIYCAPNLKDCPVCRSVINGTVRTFLS